MEQLLEYCLPITEFINSIKTLNIDCRTLRDIIQSKNYNIRVKEFPAYNLAIIYGLLCDDDLSRNDSQDQTGKNLAKKTRLVVINTLTMIPIVNFFYNIDVLNTKSFNLNDYVECDEDLNIFGKGCGTTLVEVSQIDLESEEICVFYNSGKWFAVYQYNIYLLPDDVDAHCIDNTIAGNAVQLDNIAMTINKLLDNRMINTKTLDQRSSYHFIIKHSSLRKIGSSTDESNVPTITLLYKCNMVSNKIASNEIASNEIAQNTISSDDMSSSDENHYNKEKKIYFSCVDEMLTGLDVLNFNDTVSKKLRSGGYIIKIHNLLTRTYFTLTLRTNIYNFIASQILASTHQNQYKNYLKMYQTNMLNDVLPYVHKYSLDVIKRINVSFRALSKEIVNLYHLTRKKQNVILYDEMPKTYKKILYELHKIYVGQKCFEYVKQDDDDMREKKSISVDIVYNYLKCIDSNDLIQLFFDRRTLMQNLTHIGYSYQDILYQDNIDIITQTELMML
jgi:hypothetical protein